MLHVIKKIDMFVIYFVLILFHGAHLAAKFRFHCLFPTIIYKY